MTTTQPCFADSPNGESNTTPITNPMTTLDALVNDMCFCKLRNHCADKTSAECLKHRNLYAEFMLRNQS